MGVDKLYSEILEEFQNATTKADRLAVLRKYNDARFREFLQLALNPEVKFDVEVPNYRPAQEPAGLNFSYLHIEMPKMYRFLAGHPKRPQGLTPEKQKQLLLVVLESLHKDEAQLLVDAITKKFKVKNLTQNLISEAYGT